MGIVQAPIALSAQTGVIPAKKRMVTTDNLATLTAAGYLNSVTLYEGTPVSTNDIIECLYSYNTATKTGTYEEFAVSISGTGVITLSSLSNAGEVVLPTTAGNIAVYANTIGGLTQNAATATNNGNIQAGVSGTAGTLASFPATGAKGSLVVAAVANSGNTTTTISNAAMGQATVISIPDPGGSTGNFLVAPLALVNNNIVQADGTGGLITDAGIATAAVMSKTAVNTLTGSGQIILAKANGTEAANAVTASGNAGVITTSSLTTAAGSAYAITWTNTLITATSVISLTLMGGTNTRETISLSATAGSGTSTLTINNIGPTNAFNGTILIGYTVF
jgi:hypothetical protein